MPEPTPTGPTIAIIGAGLTGLLTAHALRQSSFRVTLYDADPSLAARPRDWPLLLHWALPTLKALLSPAAAARFDDAVCNRHIEYTPAVESMPIINGVTGEVLFRPPAAPGARRVSRGRLRRVMAAEFDGTEALQWGKVLVGLEAPEGGGGPVTMAFSDGTTATADYVLGADGAASKVRELLFRGAEVARVKPSGLMVASALTRPGDEAKVREALRYHPMACVAMGTTANCGVATMYADDAKDMASWTLSWIKLWRKEKLPEATATRGPEALAWVKTTSGDLIEPFRGTIMGTRESEVGHAGGRVTLAGDAAHPMLVYRGQGYQHAVLDAQRFVEALVSVREGRVGREEAIKAYTDDVVERGAKAVTQSLKEAEMSMDLESIKNSIMARQGHGKAA
ncbi:hypothetical protein B0T18DRAFT_414364 [Schizothecium vesticola]|uniref:FAD-binding domain-containing protein n=1 Tax=Schizothecium vesticola TaxID=314040 RepID=A0AA40EPG8_9PEZI|nr:hypothetical protein B0T18DRAFT_414364 [Schizothecium vesticola]